MSDDATISHQSLRKDELRMLTTAFEDRTIEIIMAQETAPVALKRLYEAQAKNRIEFLARLQRMGLTCQPINWNELVTTEVKHDQAS